MIQTGFLLAAPLLLLAAAAVWNRSRIDSVLFLIGGAFAVGHALLWQGRSMGLPSSAAGLFLKLAVAPNALYLLGALYLVRSFATPLRGWPRWIYRAAGLTVLSPILLLFFLMILFTL